MPFIHARGLEGGRPGSRLRDPQGRRPESQHVGAFEATGAVVGRDALEEDERDAYLLRRSKRMLDELGADTRRWSPGSTPSGDRTYTSMSRGGASRRLALSMTCPATCPSTEAMKEGGGSGAGAARRASTSPATRPASPNAAVCTRRIASVSDSCSAWISTCSGTAVTVDAGPSARNPIPGYPASSIGLAQQAVRGPDQAQRLSRVQRPWFLRAPQTAATALAFRAATAATARQTTKNHVSRCGQDSQTRKSAWQPCGCR